MKPDLSLCTIVNACSSCPSGAHWRLFGSSCCIHMLLSTSCHQCSACSPSSKSAWGDCFALTPSILVLFEFALHVPETIFSTLQELKDIRQQRLEVLSKIEKVPTDYFFDAGGCLFTMYSKKLTPVVYCSCLKVCWRSRRGAGRKPQSCLKQKNKGRCKRRRGK